MKHPIGIQHRMLVHLMDNLSRTEYGRKYSIEPRTRYRAFSERVPLVEYADLEPYIARMRQGEEGVLWPGITEWYARSSGTSGSKSKYIPVTQENLSTCHYRGGYDALALYFDQHPKSNLFWGKGLTLGGSFRANTEEDGIANTGDLSAILLQNIPKWADFVRTPTREVALLSDWEQKMEGIAEQALTQNVTSITGVPSWNMVMLKHLLEVSGKSNLLEIWPNLEVFFHGGMNFAPYRPQFEELIPSPSMAYFENYNASEGFFALQNEPDKQDMLLMLDYGVFYEFIPMAEFFSENRHAIPISDVELGVNYALVLSSTNGLWRYIIGDTVEFTQLFPFKIRITGRTQHFINAFGEEIIIDNVEHALEEACKRTGAVVQEYTVAPYFMSADEQASHEWFVEFSTPPNDLAQFTKIVDETIMSLNSDYEAKRARNVTLIAPRMHSLPEGTFYGWMRHRGKMGGQNKVPRLSNDRTYAESLLEYMAQENKSVN